MIFWEIMEKFIWICSEKWCLAWWWGLVWVLAVVENDTSLMDFNSK